MPDCLASFCFSRWLEEKVNDVQTSSGHTGVFSGCEVTAISSKGEEEGGQYIWEAAKPKKLEKMA